MQIFLSHAMLRDSIIMTIKHIFSLFLLFALLTETVFAQSIMGSTPQILVESIYLLELLVIAIVAVALIVLTLSIARSRRRISKMVADIRTEMNEERVAFAMTVDSIKEKEKQISYMAHLLQDHLESDDTGSSHSKKKAISDEVVVEIVDEVVEDGTAHERFNEASVDTGSTRKVSSNSNRNQVTIDSRTIAADGSIKQAHFGPDQYLSNVDSYQYQVFERMQTSVKQADRCLSDMLNDMQGEMELVRAERTKLRDFITAIQSNISINDPKKINSKDHRIVKKLSHIDERLKVLEESHQEINQHYKETMVKLKKYTIDLSEDTVEVLDASTA